MTPSESEPQQPREESGDSTAEAIVRGVGIAVLVVLTGGLIPAITGWDPPSWAVAATVAVAVSIVVAIVRKRREEDPYAAELEKLRAEAGEASSPELTPPRSE